MKGLILAGNADQAEQYRRFRGWFVSDYPYMTRANAVRGQRVVLIIRVGTYWERRDYAEIQDVVIAFEMAGAHIKTVFDDEWKPV